MASHSEYQTGDACQPLLLISHASSGCKQTVCSLHCVCCKLFCMHQPMMHVVLDIFGLLCFLYGSQQSSITLVCMTAFDTKPACVLKQWFKCRFAAKKHIVCRCIFMSSSMHMLICITIFIALCNPTASACLLSVSSICVVLSRCMFACLAS